MPHELLETCPVVIDIPVAWGEMDAYRHVNNIVYLRWFESARIAYFDRLGVHKIKDESAIGPILASTSCRFRIPLTYPDQVSVGATVPEVGEDSFRMLYRVISHRHGKLAAEGEGLVVTFDYEAGRKAPVPEEISRRIRRLEAGG